MDHISRRNAEILALRSAGENLKTISDQFGLTRSRVWQILRANGQTTSKHEKMTPDQRELRLRTIVGLREAGVSYNKIARQIGLSYEGIRHVLREAGLFKPHHFRWQNVCLEEQHTILSLYYQGVPISKIARTIGLASRSHLALYLIRQGHHRPKLRETVWLPAEMAYIRAHYKQPGHTAATIAKHLGRTRNEIIGKANRMQLADHNGYGKLQAALRRRLKERNIRELRETGLSHAEIAQRLNIPVGTVHGYWSLMRRRHR